MWYTHLDLRLGLEIFGIATRRKTVGPWGPKSVIGHISPEPQDSSKIWKTGHLGAKNLPKTHSKHFCRGWEKKNIAKKPFFKKPKNGRFGGPWAGRTGRMGQKGVAKFCFGPRRTSGASFVKIGLGPPTVLRPSYVQSLLRAQAPRHVCNIRSPPDDVAHAICRAPPVTPLISEWVTMICRQLRFRLDHIWWSHH